MNNTLTTQAVMSVAPVERPVASAAYGFVRFIGGGLAPFAAGKLAEHTNVHVPFYIGRRPSSSASIGCWPPATGCWARPRRAQAADALHHARPPIPEPLDSEADLLLRDDPVEAGR